MDNQVIQILQQARKQLQDELAAVDASIASLEAGQSQGRTNPAVSILRKGRESFQRQLEEIDRAIMKVQAIRDGSSVPSPGVEPHDGLKTIIPGQWSRLTLPQAFRAYASERGGGPFSIKQVLDDLKLAGVKQVMTRSRFNKDKEREMDMRDIRLIGGNNPLLYDYNRNNDTIRLRSDAEVTKLRQNGVGKRTKRAWKTA
jgi:hypothetical protein